LWKPEQAICVTAPARVKHCTSSAAAAGGGQLQTNGALILQSHSQFIAQPQQKQSMQDASCVLYIGSNGTADLLDQGNTQGKR
jgi:hypothetical protein